MTTILLGPQRFLTTAGAVVRSLGVPGPVATVTAGWQDREPDDRELDDVLDGRSHNLMLYRRMMDVLERDPGFSAAALAHRDAMDELAGTYVLRLDLALEAVYAVLRRPARADLAGAAFEDALRVVRQLDAWYLERVRALYLELEATAPVAGSELVAGHRAEVAEILSGAGALAIAGGHVGILVRALRLLGVQPPDTLPVVAWSAGAMALTRRVVLFRDASAPGPSGAEVWDRGLGRAGNVVALPHARRRLRLDDRLRTMVLARRFEDSVCLLLDDGTKVVLGSDGSLPPGARFIQLDGSLGTVGVA